MAESKDVNEPETDSVKNPRLQTSASTEDKTDVHHANQYEGDPEEGQGDEAPERGSAQNVLLVFKAALGYISSYFSETTVHGFHYVIEGRNRLEKSIWLLFISLSIAYAGDSEAN